MSLLDVIVLWDILAGVGLLASLFRGVRSTYRGVQVLRMGGNGIDHKLFQLKLSSAFTITSVSALFLGLGFTTFADLPPAQLAEPADLNTGSYLLFAGNVIVTTFALMALWLDEGIDSDLEALKVRVRTADADVAEAHNVDKRIGELVQIARDAGHAEGKIESLEAEAVRTAETSKENIAATLEAQKNSTAAMIAATSATAQGIADANAALQPSIETNTAAVDANTAATEANTDTKLGEGQP